MLKKYIKIYLRYLFYNKYFSIRHFVLLKVGVLSWVRGNLLFGPESGNKKQDAIISYSNDKY